MQLLLIFVDIFQEKNANVIEFGSGRGLMSYWMAKASQLEAGQKFILVDKASHRHKYDNKLKDDTSHDIARIRADIQDLVLDQIPQIKESSVSVFFCFQQVIFSGITVYTNCLSYRNPRRFDLV